MHSNIEPSPRNSQQVKTVTDEHEKRNQVLAAEDVFRQYGGFIRSIIYQQVADNAQLAEDIFQEFFLTLIGKPIPPETRDIKRYLYKAVTNRIIDSRRRVKRYQHKLDRYALHVGLPEAKHPGNELEETRREDVNHLLEHHTTSSEAQAVRLKFLEQHDIEEIANQMGINSRSVSRYITSGISKLRKQLSEEGA